MKKILSLLIGLSLFPIFVSAQVLTVPQGGTGTTTFPNNWFVTGSSSPLRLSATGTPFFSSFSFGTATGTAATTTSFFSGTSSSTNLFATALTAGNTTLGALTVGLVNSQTISSAANFTGTLAVSGHVTFEGVTSTGASGTGKLVFDGSPTIITPTITTSATAPLVIGGTGVGSSLALQSTSGVGTTDFIRFLTGNNGGTEAARFLTSGIFGIGTTTPIARVDIAGTLGSQIDLLNVSSTTASNVVSSLLKVTATGKVGVGSSTPTTIFSVGSGAISVAENQPATSTTPTISWLNGNQQLYRHGTSATTFTFSNYIAGQKLVLVVCNPHSGTAGAITWDPAILWSAGTIPTQTTTADKCDIWSFLATNGTSTLKILGAQNANF